MAQSDFSKAFAAARKEKGAGKTFTFKGKSYSTNYASDAVKAPTPRPKARSAAPRTSPRPTARPSFPTYAEWRKDNKGGLRGYTMAKNRANNK